MEFKMETASTFTIKDLLQNPAGKYSRQVGARYAIKERWVQTYIDLLSDPVTKARFRVTVSGADPYLIWVKVPSTLYKIDYDVLIRVFKNEDSKSFKQALVELYCNSPSWVFTYAYVAHKQKFLIEEWHKALGKAYTEKPTVTNPQMLNGHDKIVTVALLHLTEGLNIETLSDVANLPKLDAPDPKDETMHAITILRRYEKLKLSSPKKVNKNEELMKLTAKLRQDIDTQANKGSGLAKTNRVKSVSAVKRKSFKK